MLWDFSPEKALCRMKKGGVLIPLAFISCMSTCQGGFPASQPPPPLPGETPRPPGNGVEASPLGDPKSWSVQLVQSPLGAQILVRRAFEQTSDEKLPTLLPGRMHRHPVFIATGGKFTTDQRVENNLWFQGIFSSITLDVEIERVRLRMIIKWFPKAMQGARVGPVLPIILHDISANHRFLYQTVRFKFHLYP